MGDTMGTHLYEFRSLTWFTPHNHRLADRLSDSVSAFTIRREKPAAALSGPLDFPVHLRQAPQVGESVFTTKGWTAG